jgi:DNA-binding NarL/FixJ family response regulator
MLREEAYVRAALGAGIDGYLLKDASCEELMTSLQSVASGKMYLSPSVSGYVVECFLHPENARSEKSRAELLTSRERGILQLIAEGRTNRSTAEFLCVSSKTVEKHRSRLMQKLGLHSSAELTMAAVEMGLIQRPVSICRLMGNQPCAFSATQAASPTSSYGQVAG